MKKLNQMRFARSFLFHHRTLDVQDALLIEYHQLLFDEATKYEGQNIIYVPEQNPFEVYRTLSQTITDYNETLAVVKGCDIVISTFSSKLLSIGALLCLRV